MADITNEAIIKYINTDLRPMAVNMLKLYYQCKNVKSIWDAQALTNEIANTTDDAVVDDRPDQFAITGRNCHDGYNRMSAFITMVEGAGVLDTIIRLAGRNIEIN